MAENLNVMDWAAEALELSKEYVYDGIKETELPSDDYIQRGAEVAQKQIVLGGSRLANMLMKYDFSGFNTDKYADIEKLRVVHPKHEKNIESKHDNSVTWSIKSMLKNIIEKLTPDYI